MKTLLSTILVIGFFASPALASDTLNQIVNPETTKKTSSVKKRRKKVEICKECGKPETKCDCEGDHHRHGKPAKK